MSDVIQIVGGTLQGILSSTVFILALFIGFCIIVGFTKTKRTAGNVAVDQEPRRDHQPPADDLLDAQLRRVGRPISSIRPNSSRLPRVEVRAAPSAAA